MKKLIKKCMRLLPDSWHISLMYYHTFKRFPNLKNPKTFNEKLQWLKLHDRKPEYTVMVDKHLVKKYVADKIGEEYIIPTLGVWKKATDIDFDSLPDQFVLKWNHDSGSIVVCKDKNTLDRESAIKKLSGKETHNGFLYGREWPYKNIEPCIIAEQYLEDEETKELRDYKFYCFGGKPKFLYVSRGLGGDHKDAEISFYDLNWKKAAFQRGDFKAISVVPKKPERFDEMIQLASVLSENTPFLRVDLYEVNGKIYFSELTFFPCSGFMPFDPPEWDEKIGEMLILPNKTE